MTVGDYAELGSTPYQGATGNPTVLQETAFSTIPGSPAYVSKSEHFRRTESSHGLSDVDISGNNAIQGAFRFSPNPVAATGAVDRSFPDEGADRCTAHSSQVSDRSAGPTWSWSGAWWAWPGP